MLRSRKSAGPYSEKVHEIAESEIPMAPKQILLLEDDFQYVELLKDYLLSHSFRVTTASNGAQGLKHIATAHYDVVLCDMVMPNLSGDMFYMAVQRIRPELCKRFIFITGHKGDPKIDSFIRSVRGLVLWKPFQLNDMLEAIQSVLKKNETPSR